MSVDIRNKKAEFRYFLTDFDRINYDFHTFSRASNLSLNNGILLSSLPLQ